MMDAWVRCSRRLRMHSLVDAGSIRDRRGRSLWADGLRRSMITGSMISDRCRIIRRRCRRSGPGRRRGARGLRTLCLEIRGGTCRFMVSRGRGGRVGGPRVLVVLRLLLRLLLVPLPLLMRQVKQRVGPRLDKWRLDWLRRRLLSQHGVALEAGC